ncbi:conserved hypothetical protein [Desulfonatronospira thiodismutans ASO3-1]|uniref:Uncharacterized protein n=1 Tax=Desulfonatronospira thiodismutans ASO3-1 TaxID=555779 RepID=D6SPQ3_9BACT|nr:hypothetical protein [Desulfonatronospira thiodismutans]EFI34729.1 conserved hypothetical protein [Desulfonatronospira thiodismutans ASO3-1]
MAVTDLMCSVYQGFNFQKDQQDRVGHITSLTIGDDEISADLKVTDPEDLSATVDAVGVISRIAWDGGFAEPIIASFRVSRSNKNVLATKQHQSLAKTGVKIAFNVYEYDQGNSAYFKCFHTDETDLNGVIYKRGGELQFNVELEEAQDVMKPSNYEMFLGVAPTDEAQEIQMAISVSDKFTKGWGVEVS